MEREGAAVTCDGRLFHRRAAATGYRKRSVADSGQTSIYVERPETLMRQNVVVVWLECLLVDVVRHRCAVAPDHNDICTPEQRHTG